MLLGSAHRPLGEFSAGQLPEHSRRAPGSAKWQLRAHCTKHMFLVDAAGHLEDCSGARG